MMMNSTRPQVDTLEVKLHKSGKRIVHLPFPKQKAIYGIIHNDEFHTLKCAAVALVAMVALTMLSCGHQRQDAQKLTKADNKGSTATRRVVAADFVHTAAKLQISYEILTKRHKKR